MNPLKRRSTDHIAVVDTDLNLCLRIEALNKDALELKRQIRSLQLEVKKLRAESEAKSEALRHALILNEQRLQAAAMSFEDNARRADMDLVKSEFQIKIDKLVQFITKLKESLT